VEVCAFIIVFSMNAFLYCNQWISELAIFLLAAHKFMHLSFWCHWL